MAGSIEVTRYASGATLLELELDLSDADLDRVEGLLLDTEIPAADDGWETTVVVRQSSGDLFVTCSGADWLVSYLPSADGADVQSLETPGATGEVELSLGGLVAPWPRALIVPRDVALAAFRAFADDGRLVPGNWATPH